MLNRLRLAIIAAIAFGLIAGYGIYDFLRQQRLALAELRAASEDVVVAAQDIPAGTTITPDMVEVKSYYKNSLPPGTLPSPEEVVGKAVKVDVAAGEPILASRFSEGIGLTVLLSPGQRAMAIKVNEFIGVSGFLGPNDRVDVIARLNHPTRDGSVSKVVLQNRRVLSVAQKTEGSKDGKARVVRSITLELAPEEAEKLALASLEGNILLALRGMEDHTLVQTRGSTTRDLLEFTPPRTKRTVIRRQHRVELYSGSHKAEYRF